MSQEQEEEQEEHDDALDVSDLPLFFGELSGVIVCIIGAVTLWLSGVSALWGLAGGLAILFATDQITHLVAHLKTRSSLADILSHGLYASDDVAVVIQPGVKQHVTLLAWLSPALAVPYKFYWFSLWPLSKTRKVPHVFLVLKSTRVFVPVNKDAKSGEVSGISFIADYSADFVKEAIGPTADGVVNPGRAISNLIVQIVKESVVQLPRPSRSSNMRLTEALAKKLQERRVEARDFVIQIRHEQPLH